MKHLRVHAQAKPSPATHLFGYEILSFTGFDLSSPSNKVEAIYITIRGDICLEYKFYFCSWREKWSDIQSESIWSFYPVLLYIYIVTYIQVRQSRERIRVF